MAKKTINDIFADYQIVAVNVVVYTEEKEHFYELSIESMSNPDVLSIKVSIAMHTINEYDLKMWDGRTLEEYINSLNFDS